MDHKYSLSDNNSIAIYDGQCSMCSSFVQFVLKHEKNDKILFTPLDSQFSKSISKDHLGDSVPDSIIYIKGNQISIESNAVAEISKELKWPFAIFQYIVIIPRPIRDFVYRFIAKHRKKIFDSSPEACRIDHNFSNRIID